MEKFKYIAKPFSKIMGKRRELMQPIHAVVPREIRERVMSVAAAENASLGEVVRNLLSEALEARGLVV